MYRLRNGVIAVCIVCFTFCGGCALQNANVTSIRTAQEMKSRLEGGKLQLIHSLDASHYAKGHIPGAVNIDYEKMTPESLPPDKSQPIVFYCTGGMCPVGRMAADRAAKWGYTQVSVFEGGLKAWTSAGMPVERSEP